MKLKMLERIPKIFKETDRCSREKMPGIGQRCMFSHALRLLRNEFVPQERPFRRDGIHQGAQCKVLGFIFPDPSVVVVRFDCSDQDDLVSPEFLIPLKLTTFGEMLLNSSPKLLAILVNFNVERMKHEDN